MTHANADGRVARRIRVGLLGAGYIAEWHAGSLRSIDGVEVAAICDRDLARAEALAGRLGVRSATDSLDRMLSVEGLDAVHVLLPPEHHAAAARTVLGAGKHVFLEKPMAVDEAECDDLISIASCGGLKLGVGHNFLYSRVYQELKEDLARGRLGPIDRVSIVWNKPLGQVEAGPFDGWLFSQPEHVMLEIGPHSFAHAIDLLADFSIVASRAGDPVELPGGRRFFRRWTIDGEAGRAGVSLAFSFSRGFSEHYIHIRGGIASAAVDFENNTYSLQRHTKYGVDLDRYIMAARRGSKLRSGARTNLAHYALSKLHLSSRGNAYGESIGRAIASFYEGMGREELDRRISAGLGREVVHQCREAGRLAGVGMISSPAVADVGLIAKGPQAPREVLVLGATGFIGKELTRQLVAQGRHVRILARDASRVAEATGPGSVEVVVGDASRRADLDRALGGIDCVIHLARSQSKTWDEYRRRDVLVTEEIAEACLDRGARRLIYTGTIDSFYAGRRAGKIGDDTPLDTAIERRNNYARAKAASEASLLRLHSARGLPVVIMRPGIVIGRGGHPHHWGVGMWPWDSVCQVWGDGRNGLPIVLVGDVARALVLAINAPGIEGEAFNLVGPQCISARDYLDEIERQAGVEIQKFFIPPWRFFLADLCKFAVKVVVRHPGRRLVGYRDWETRTQHAAYECTKARDRIGWVPTEDRDEIIRLGIHVPVQEFLR